MEWLAELIYKISIVWLYFSFVVLCYLAYELKWLTASASVMAFFIALIFSFGGIQMFFIPLVLFVGGSVLSKLNKDPHEKKGRNVVQVLSNGLIGICCLSVHYYYKHYNELNHYYHHYYHSFEDIALLAYLISFSISVCDTFSSEVGKFCKGETWDIMSFKPIKKGLSGGISLEGTIIGGVLGLLLCTFLAYFSFNLSVGNSILIFVFGFAGMLLDSVLGSLFQAKYQNSDGETEEVKSADNRLIAGYSWCNNDAVNMLSNAYTTALFILLKVSGLI